MKFDIDNPAFLQSASNLMPKSTIIMYYSNSNAKQIALESDGRLTVRYDNTAYFVNNVDGTVYIDIPSGVSPGSPIYITGDADRFVDPDADGLYEYVSKIDLSRAIALQEVFLSGSTHLDTIIARGDSESLANSIAELIGHSAISDGVVYLRNRTDQYNQIIIDSALNKGWDYNYL